VKKLIAKISAKLHESKSSRAAWQKLVAVTGGDRNLVAALGAAAAQHGSAGLAGHAAQKSVNLAAAAAIGLEGALRHRRNPVLEKIVLAADAIHQTRFVSRDPHQLSRSSR
jgi:hypothetical protein